MSEPRPALTGFPVNLLVRGRRCLVVGAGPVATRKVEGLLAAGAVVDVVAPVATPVVESLAAAGAVTLHRREFAIGDVDGAWLVVTATGDPEVDRAVYEAGEAARVWVNSADSPAHCSFTLMSTSRRGDIVVTIGTGGRSPALAQHLRRRIEELVGPEYETVLDLLAEVRESVRAAGGSSLDVDWPRAFDSGIVELVRTGRVAEARELLRSCL